MAKPITHTVENLEAGQRDSIRRAQAKAGGAKPEEYNNLPSDAEIQQAAAEAQEEQQEEASTPQPKAQTPSPTPRGPSSSGQSSSGEGS